MLTYAEDPVAGWIVVIGDVVIALKNSEQECIDYIAGYQNFDNKKAQSSAID